MRKELVVAEKEFRDYLTSRRFLAMFAILMLLGIVGLVTGMDNYNQQLDQYKQNQDRNANDPGYQQMVQSMNMQLQNLTESGASAQEIENMRYQVEQMTSPPMPSIIMIFYSISSPFYMVGMILAISMGFDLISKEKDEGSLKSLLSRPIYRDAVINGKAIAAIATLAIVLAATFLITFAILLFYGRVPQGDDLMRLIALFVVSLLYCMVFFAIAMMISTIAKSSSAALLITLGIVVLFYVLPSISYPVTQMIIGPYPQPPLYSPGDDPMKMQELNDRFQQQQQDYYQKQRQLNDIINGISPQYQYGQLTNVISSRYNPNSFMNPYQDLRNRNLTLWDSLSFAWVGLVVILVELIISFAVSYVSFMRMDIR